MTGAPTRLSGPQRREQIARAALDIIGRQGLTALTTTALAQKIGVTSGALFRHFATRDAILEEAVRFAETAIDGTYPEDTLPPGERLRAFAQARIALLKKQPGLAWLLRSDQARLTLPPAGVKRTRAVVRRSRAYLRTAFDEAAASGSVRNDVSVDVLLLTFTATVHALIGRGGSARATAEALDGLFQLLAPVGSRNRKR